MRSRLAFFVSLGFFFAAPAIVSSAAGAELTLLNVSYDVSRELYKEINPAFSAWWKRQGGGDITVNQSHGGSSRQAMSVAAGLEADVVTMNQQPEIDLLTLQHLVAEDWKKSFPYDAAPYTTVSVFLVRKGNPKAIKDWPDLTRPDVSVVVPNPKTSGNGRYTYLAAWGYALKQPGGNPARAREFVADLFRNVPVLDGGGRGATVTFTQRNIGDALVTFENEAVMITAELGGDQFEVVYPSISIEAFAPVAVILPVTEKRGTRAAANAYLNFLFSRQGQEIIARHYFRPRDPIVLKANAKRFPAIQTFTVEKDLGGWAEAQRLHFVDGALYDQISEH